MVKELNKIRKHLIKYIQKGNVQDYYICLNYYMAKRKPINYKVIGYLRELGNDNIEGFGRRKDGRGYRNAFVYKGDNYNKSKFNHIKMAIKKLRKELG